MDPIEMSNIHGKQVMQTAWRYNEGLEWIQIEFDDGTWLSIEPDGFEHLKVEVKT